MILVVFGRDSTCQHIKLVSLLVKIYSFGIEINIPKLSSETYIRVQVLLYQAQYAFDSLWMKTNRYHSDKLEIINVQFDSLFDFNRVLG